LVQLPQNCTSLVTSTQLLPHWVKVPQPTWHTPALHACPTGQIIPQPPQLLPSVKKFLQPSEHAMKPAWHWHTPAEHALPAGQTLLHIPQ
jgi:hypothetical protein